jgi:hypothetical protein
VRVSPHTAQIYKQSPVLRQNRLSYYKFTNVYLLVAVWVKQNPVGQGIGPAMHPILQVMVVPACLVRQGTATMRAEPAL